MFAQSRKWNRVWVWMLMGGVAGLLWFSYRLAGMRIFQVDECQNVYEARLLGSGLAHQAYVHLSLFQFPIVWLTRGASQSIDLFIRGRFLMWEIFWLNLFLIALATGERLLSGRGLIALVGAATLAPLWDYGFEIRHDNVLLTGLLLTWYAVRVRPAGMQSYLIAGAVAAGLEFVAFKSFVYTVPLSLAILVFPHPNHRAPRWKLVVAWAAGAIAVLLCVRFAYGEAGLWDVCLRDFHRVWGDAESGNRFWPWQTLARLLTQTPLLLALTAAGLAAATVEVKRRGKGALTWDGNLPEVLFFLVALGALLINPAPYPYNLLHLVPYAYLVAFRYGLGLLKELPDRAAFLPVVGAIVLFAHMVPFAIATRRHLDWTNFHQEGLMQLAEDLTDPVKDPVYDGVGLVPTRPSIHFQWLLHSLNIRTIAKGPGPRLRDMLAARPAAVFIPNYRTDWLPAADHEFIRERYVSLADDFWVLGRVFPAGGGTFEIVHSGRYRISALSGSDIVGTYPTGWDALRTPEDPGSLTCQLDGVPFSGGVVELAAGKHRIETAADCQAAAVWVGPHRDRIHRLSVNDHRRLFYNWY